MNLLLKNIDIITGEDSAGFIKNSNIGIKDGMIEFVGNDMDTIESFKPDRVIDGRHRLAMPGLVNSHTHSGMTILRNFADDLALEEWLFEKIFPAEERLTPEDVYWGTLLGIAEMIKAGTTAFADMYLHMDFVAQAVTEAGIRANLCRNPVKFNFGSEPGICDDTQGCFDYYKKWNGSADGRIKVYVEVHSAYLFNEASLKSAAGLAKSCGTGIHIHILETAREREVSKEKYGADTVEVCERCGIFDVPVLAAHCVHLTDENVEVLKNKGVYVVHNPTSNLKLGSGIARIPFMLEEGLVVSLGTDGTSSNNNLNMFEEMHLAALLHKGVSRNPKLIGADQTVKMATVNGAKAIGFGDETGCIKKGLRADLIILDTDKPHLCPMNNPVSAVVYSAQAADVDTVIVDGQILMEGRELKTIDEERAKSKVKEIAARILV